MHTLVCNTTRVARVRAYACTCMYTTYHSLRARTMHTMHCIDTLLDTTTVAMHRVCILSNYDRRMHNMHTMHSTLVDNTLEYAYSRTSLVMYITFRVPRELVCAARVPSPRTGVATRQIGTRAPPKTGCGSYRDHQFSRPNVF